MGGVVGKVEDFEEDLIRFQGWNLGGGLLEGGIGAREGRKIDGFGGEDPLTGGAWEGHGR